MSFELYTQRTFSDFIYASCLEKFGIVESMRHKAQRIQMATQLRKLKVEKKALLSRWKRSADVERVGLSVLWKEVKRRINIRCKAEKARQTRARQEFFRDPYRYGISLLELPRSGTLTTSQAELEAYLTKTYTDALRNRPLPERTEISEALRPACPFSIAAPSIEEVRRIKKKRQETAPRPALMEFHICYVKDVQQPSYCFRPL